MTASGAPEAGAAMAVADVGAPPRPGLGLADLRWWTRRHAGPIVHRWPMVSWWTVGKEPARVARGCRRRAVAFAANNAAWVPLNVVLFGNVLWAVLAAEAAAQCLVQWHLWRTHADAFEDRIRDRQRLAGAWPAHRRPGRPTGG